MMLWKLRPARGGALVPEADTWFRGHLQPVVPRGPRGHPWPSISRPSPQIPDLTAAFKSPSFKAACLAPWQNTQVEVRK